MALNQAVSVAGRHLNGSSATRQHMRNKKRKLKKKAARQRKRTEIQQFPNDNSASSEVSENGTDGSSSSDDELIKFELKGPFERFKLAEDEVVDVPVKPASHTDINLKARTAALLAEEAGVNEDKWQRRSGFSDDPDTLKTGGKSQQGRSKNATADSVDGTEVLSKKKLKRLTRPTVASLKQAVNRPDVVEMWDVCAKDPLTLINLKAYRNTVPVPRHWCAKRKYLQGKRGFEKPPFHLPEFIARTGIMEMRQTVQDKDGDKTLKTKMREKIRPKVGKVDIDYHKLHDAFFKYQTKPKMSIHGDLYHEGKEFEVKLKEKKPGNLSDDLRTALGLPSGVGAERYPPPWLIAMQRYGPPPSYPNLKIAGLNAPIPDGCAFGYHPGGWGKPPVDELGRPVYGDVFGNGGNIAGVPPPPPAPLDEADEEIAHGHITYWGELESDEESEAEEEDDQMESDEGSDAELPPAAATPAEVTQSIVPLLAAGRKPTDVDMGGMVTPAGGLITPSGVSSVGVGLETPQSTIELRKKTIEEAMEDSSGLVTPSSQLYRVLPERETNPQAGALLGSTKLYDVAGVGAAPRGMEAENPRDSMLRKRPSGTDSQTAGQATSGVKSGASSATNSLQPAPPPAAKKYKEFKF